MAIPGFMVPFDHVIDITDHHSWSSYCMDGNTNFKSYLCNKCYIKIRSKLNQREVSYNSERKAEGYFRMDLP